MAHITTSVIIPAFQAQSFLGRAVASVLRQSRQDFEIVIASDDGRDYRPILEARGLMDPRITCVSTGGLGTGAAHARNVALARSKGGLIVGLDADDELFPNHLERMVPLALSHGLAISQIELVDHESQERLPNRAKPFAAGLLTLADAMQACLHTYAPVVFDRERINIRWNERVPPLEDAVFFAECFNHLPAAWYESTPTYRYYRRADSLCNAPGAAQRFLQAGQAILNELRGGGIDSSNEEVGRVLRAYVHRSNSLERAFHDALSNGEVRDYQEFLGRNLDLLHAPLR